MIHKRSAPKLKILLCFPSYSQAQISSSTNIKTTKQYITTATNMSSNKTTNTNQDKVKDETPNPSSSQLSRPPLGRRITSQGTPNWPPKTDTSLPNEWVHSRGCNQKQGVREPPPNNGTPGETLDESYKLYYHRHDKANGTVRLLYNVEPETAENFYVNHYHRWDHNNHEPENGAHFSQTKGRRASIESWNDADEQGDPVKIDKSGKAKPPIKILKSSCLPEYS